jgi:hypothetical protein
MTEEEFTALTLSEKWRHVSTVMDYITSTDKMYQLRKRLNPHHPKEQAKEEQRNMRLDQYQRWAHVKSLYALHRDEMTNTLDSQEYAKCKLILESVFTLELDDALREVINEE